MSQAGTLTSSSSPSPTNSFDPASRLQLSEDFTGGTQIVQLQTSTFAGIAFGGPSFLSTHPGMFVASPIMNSANFIFYNDQNTTLDEFIIGAGVIKCNFVIDLVSLSTPASTYTAFIGFGDHQSIANSLPPTIGMYFQYSDAVNSGNWQYVCQDSFGTSVGNSLVPATTGFHNYGVVINATGTAVDFYIDGIKINPVSTTTNIPTTICPAMTIVPALGATPPATLIDLWYFSIDLTVPR